MVAEKHDYSKLRGRIVEKYGTCSNLAKVGKFDRCLFSQKMNNRVHFTTKNIDKLCEMLDIPSTEVGIFFFTPLV